MEITEETAIELTKAMTSVGEALKEFADVSKSILMLANEHLEQQREKEAKYEEERKKREAERGEDDIFSGSLFISPTQQSIQRAFMEKIDNLSSKYVNADVQERVGILKEIRELDAEMRRIVALLK